VGEKGLPKDIGFAVVFSLLALPSLFSRATFLKLQLTFPLLRFTLSMVFMLSRKAALQISRAVTTFLFYTIRIDIELFSSLGLTRNAKITDGQSSLISFGGTWGTWQGYGLSILLDKHDDRKTLTAGAMAGGILGLITTAGVTRKMDISTGDASLISSGGLWGAWFALMFSALAEIKSGNASLTTVLAGGDVGVLLMAGLTPTIDRDASKTRQHSFLSILDGF